MFNYPRGYVYVRSSENPSIFSRGRHFPKIWPSGSSTPASTLLELQKSFETPSMFSRGRHFSKIRPAGGSTPASTLLGKFKKVFDFSPIPWNESSTDRKYVLKPCLESKFLDWLPTVWTAFSIFKQGASRGAASGGSDFWKMTSPRKYWRIFETFSWFCLELPWG